MFDRPRDIKKLSTGASVAYTAYDWSLVTSTTVMVKGRSWPIGNGVGKAIGLLQSHALNVFSTTGETLAAIQSDKDLNDEAKTRRSLLILDDAAETLAAPYSALMTAWENAASSAIEGFDPTVALAPTDAVGASTDVELRSIVRGMAAQERMRLMATASAGKEPEITAAVLRGAPIASGLSADAMEQLRGAGVVAANRDALSAIKALGFVSFEAEKLAQTVTKTLVEIAKAGYHAGLVKAVQGRTDQDMRDYLQSLPL